MQLHRIPVSAIDPDPDNPRKTFVDADIMALGSDMDARGQLVAIILYRDGEKLRIADGERRWRAASSAGIPELDAVILPEKPDRKELRLMQLSIEVHKSSISALERSDLLRELREDHGWSIAELAAQVNMKQPVVSKLLACQRLDKGIQQLVHRNALDLEKAFIISQEPSFERQREMVKLYAHLPREQFRQKAKPSTGPETLTVKRARFYLPGGASVMVHGPALTLSDAIAALLETVRQLKRGQAQNKDIVAAQKDMRKKARTKNVSVSEKSAG